MSSAGFLGGALRHVALAGDRWLAPVGRQAGAFSVGVRDRGIGWTPEARMRRLHLVASDSRFEVFRSDWNRPPRKRRAKPAASIMPRICCVIGRLTGLLSVTKRGLAIPASAQAAGSSSLRLTPNLIWVG